MHRLLHAFRPVFRLLKPLTDRFLLPRLLRVPGMDDPWTRIDVGYELGYVSWAARYDFAWYFEGDSRVPVKSLHELRSWLRKCRYVRDPELFHEIDYWQHPRTFEQLGRGDCEDFALWAWRKLVEMGYDADLVFGSCHPAEPHRSMHAWIVYRRDGSEWLMEPTRARSADWVRPLAEAGPEYLPYYGVGPDLRRFTFAGYLISLARGKGQAPSPPEAARAAASG